MIEPDEALSGPYYHYLPEKDIAPEQGYRTSSYTVDNVFGKMSNRLERDVTPPVGRERPLSGEKTLTASAQTLGDQRSEGKCSEEDQVTCQGWTICKLRV